MEDLYHNLTGNHNGDTHAIPVESPVIDTKFILENKDTFFSNILNLIENIEDGYIDALKYYSFFVELEELSKQAKEHVRTLAVDESNKYSKDELKDMGWELGSTTRYEYPDTDYLNTLNGVLNDVKSDIKKIKAVYLSNLKNGVDTTEKASVLGSTEFLKRVKKR